MHAPVCWAGLLAIVLCLPLAADPLRTGHPDCDKRLAGHPQGTEAARTSQCPAPSMMPMLAPPDPLGDITAGRGPNHHRRELAAIAVYIATGNKDAADRLIRELRKFGVSAEEIQNAIDTYKLHHGSGEASHPLEARSAPADALGAHAF